MAASTSQTFASCYIDFCKQQHLRPLPVISVTLPHSLDFATDRVKMDDWGPILDSLSLDQSLKSISVRSRYQCRKPLEEVNNTEEKTRAIGRSPVVLTRYLLEWLSHSVGQCVRNSPALTSLELEGIPLPADCLAVLCVGIASTKTLRHLSLQRCRIGDGSCELICRTVADAHSIRSLNLSQCDLTFRSGAVLASALSRQKLMLYHDTWIDSLRYREPNFEAMPGLRRLTLSGNPQLGDSAVNEIIEAIRDSLWLKALDLQNCGLTNAAAGQFLDLLNSNLTLAVVDVRLNAIGEEFLHEIAGKLEDNNDGGSPEYRWMPLPQRGKPATTDCQNRAIQCQGSQAKTGLPARARTAVSRQPKRPCRQAVAQLRAWTTGKRSEAKPTSPGLLDVGKSVEPERLKTVENSPVRASLKIHLPTNAKAEDIESIVRGDNLEVSSRDGRNFKIEDLILQHEKLLEETIRRKDLLLADEKMRREIAEGKLRAMNEDLVDLEAALKTKEEETRGFLLISHQSLDDICTTFDRLLEMLDSVTKNPNSTARRNVDDEVVARETMKRHLAHLIRKTKSESLSRAVSPGPANAAAETLRTADNVARKSTRSDTDLRTSLPHISTPIHLEKNIGDSPDVMSPSRGDTINRFQEANKLFDSPGQRARAIFAQIVRDGSLLTIGSHVG